MSQNAKKKLILTDHEQRLEGRPRLCCEVLNTDKGWRVCLEVCGTEHSHDDAKTRKATKEEVELIERGYRFLPEGNAYAYPDCVIVRDFRK